MTTYEVKQLVIKPVVRPKFSGISSYTNAFVTISTELSSKTKLYKTGLTPAEARHYEKEIGLEHGVLSPNPNNPKSADFWGGMSVRLFADKPTFITIEGPLDELKERIIRNSSKIAENSLKAKQSGSALFYIDDPEAVAKEESTIIDSKYEAMKALLDTSPEEKRGILRLYGRLAETMSETMVKAELAKKVELDPKDFLDKIRDKDLKTRIFLEELIDAGLLKKKGPYTYNGDDMIGGSSDEVIAYLSDIKNQSIKLNLSNKLKAYRSGRSPKKGKDQIDNVVD